MNDLSYLIEEIKQINEGSAAENERRRKAKIMLAQMGHNPYTTSLDYSSDTTGPNYRIPTENLPVLRKIGHGETPEKRIYMSKAKSKAYLDTISDPNTITMYDRFPEKEQSTPEVKEKRKAGRPKKIKEPQNVEPIKETPIPISELPIKEPQERIEPIVKKIKLGKKGGSGYLYSIRHPQFADPEIKRGEDSEPITYIKTNPNDSTTFFTGRWPSGHSIDGKPEEGELNLYWPNGKKVSIYNNLSYEIKNPGEENIFKQTHPNNNEKIKNIIEKHAAEAHGQMENSYPLNTLHFHDFGIPSEEWQLPETHPLAKLGENE